MAGRGLAALPSNGTLTNYTPTLRERMADALRRTFYSDDLAGQQQAEKVLNFGEAVTPLGTLTGAYDAGRDAGQGSYGGAALQLGMMALPGKKMPQIKNFKGEKINPPRTFYRGTVPGNTERIRTGAADWDSYLFAADNQDAARLYGPSIETINAAPDANILYEGTREWINTVGKWRKDENLLEYADRATKAAKAAGYDATWFKRQGDVGTAIVNPGKFIRGGK